MCIQELSQCGFHWRVIARTLGFYWVLPYIKGGQLEVFWVESGRWSLSPRAPNALGKLGVFSTSYIAQLKQAICVDEGGLDDSWGAATAYLTAFIFHDT